MFQKIFDHLQSAFEQDFSLGALKILIILWSFIIILLAIAIDDKWILAGILAYEVLP
jgi:hypothetical protein